MYALLYFGQCSQKSTGLEKLFQNSSGRVTALPAVRDKGVFKEASSLVSNWVNGSFCA